MPPARPLRILVVDDDPAMVGAITALVGTEGHQVITAYDGAEALVGDLRSLAPLDVPLILRSVRATGKVLIAEKPLSIAERGVRPGNICVNR